MAFDEGGGWRLPSEIEMKYKKSFTCTNGFLKISNATIHEYLCETLNFYELVRIRVMIFI